MTQQRPLVPLDWVVLRRPRFGAAIFERLAASDTEEGFAHAVVEHALGDPVIFEAIALASPSLARRLMAEGASLQWGELQDIYASVARYINRMCYRCTPFGKFSSVVGWPVASHTVFSSEAFKVVASLDMEASRWLHGHLNSLRPFGKRLVKVNDSAYCLAGEVRFTAIRYNGKEKSFHLVGIPSGVVIDFLMSQVDAICENDLVDLLRRNFELSQIQATAYIQRLQACGFLNPASDLVVSGRHDPVRGLGACVAPEDLAARNSLDAVVQMLEEVQAGASVEAAGRVIAESTGEVVPGDIKNVVQIDLVGWESGNSVARSALERVCDQLWEIYPHFSQASDVEIQEFAKSLEARYGDRPVALLEALDEEAGVGFGPRRKLTAPLIEGLALARVRPEAPAAQVHRSIDSVLAEKYAVAISTGDIEVVIEESDLASLRGRKDLQFPRTATILGSFLAESAGYLDGEGEFYFALNSVVGATAASLVGRFAYGNAELEARLSDIASLDAVNADILHADIVHLPADRVGNIVARPDIRDYDICYQGKSAKLASNVIEVRDLMVRCSNGRVLLYSRRLNKPVMPFLSNMHNFASAGNLPVYRFLCTYARSMYAGGGYGWGGVRVGAFRPRIRYKSLVLRPAEWVFPLSEIAMLSRVAEDDRFAEFDEIRRSRGIPDNVFIGLGDNTLDFDLSRRSTFPLFWSELKKANKDAPILERLESSLGFALGGRDRGCRHEVMVPVYCQNTHSYLEKALAGPSTHHLGPVEEKRLFVPGSEWLFVKIYSGVLEADRFLYDVVRRLPRALLDDGVIQSWFFIRYADPEPHIRLRLQGNDAVALWERGYQQILREIGSDNLESGRWRVALDTYKPEYDRYGGVEMSMCAERLFMVDSQAVLDALGELKKAGGAEQIRWLIAAVSASRLLEDFLDGDQDKLSLMSSLAKAYREEFNMNSAQIKAMDARYRKERQQIEVALQRSSDIPVIESVHRIFDRRSEVVREVVAELRNFSARSSFDYLRCLPSYIHMSMDRIFPAMLREQEAVLYSFLSKYYRTVCARQVPAP